MTLEQLAAFGLTYEHLVGAVLSRWRTVEADKIRLAQMAIENPGARYFSIGRAGLVIGEKGQITWWRREG